jgi:hypothetical protein
VINWKQVTKENQLKEGTKLKIVGLNPRDSYKWITVKKVLNMESCDGKKWIEILINKRKNYYFNLTAFLNDEPTWGGWVKELYFEDLTTQSE